MSKETDKLNVKAIAEAGEIEHFSRDFFVKGGAVGGKKRWADKTAEEKKAHMSMMGKISGAKKKKDLSTGLSKEDLSANPPSDIV